MEARGGGVIGAAKAIAAHSDRWMVKEWVVPVLNKTVTAGDIVLEDIGNPFGESVQFPLYRFCPMWVDGGAMSVIANMIGPQQEVNKRRSQALHICRKPLYPLKSVLEWIEQQVEKEKR